MDVAIDSAGAVWLAGNFTGTTSGLATLTAAGDPALLHSDAMLLKLSATTTSFAADVERVFGGVGDDRAAAVAVDPTNNVVLGGSFQFSVDFDVAPDSAFTLHSSGDEDVYFVKLASEGAFQWARAIGGFRADRLADLTIDTAGHIYGTGEFRDRVDFDPLDGTYLLVTSTETTPEAFLNKLDRDGAFLWAAQLGDRDGTVSIGNGLAVSDQGRVASVGQFQNTVDFDPTEGVQLRTFTPSDPDAFAGYLSLLDQKGIPLAAISGLPSGPLLEGTVLGLAAQVTDADSIRFTYQWNVTRDGQYYASGSKSALTAPLDDQGTYTIDLVVLDESGNRDTASATLVVNNAPPVVQAAMYGAATRLLTGGTLGSVDAEEGFGSSLAAGSRYVLIGSPAGNEAWLYDPAETTAATQIKEFIAAPLGAAATDQFGYAVANLGDRLIIGAPGAGGTGAVYVYQRDPGAGDLQEAVQNFQLVQTITGPSAASGDRFGASVTAVGELILIGAPGAQRWSARGGRSLPGRSAIRQAGANVPQSDTEPAGRVRRGQYRGRRQSADRRSG